MSLELLGATEIGIEAADFGTLFKAAGEVAQGGITMYEKKQASEKSAAEEKAQLDAVIAADIAASHASAKAEVAVQLKSASADADKAAAAVAAQAQDRKGAKLSPSAAEKRADAADRALDNAVSQAQANPKDAYKAALVKAWTATVNKAHNAQIKGAGDSEGGESGKSDRKGGSGGSGGGDSWLTRPLLGPVPGWGVAAGGAGLLALLAKNLLR